MIPTAQAIAAVLSLVPTPASFAELDARVAHGLPKGALRASVNRVCATAEQRTRLLHRIVPVASYKRRRTALTPDESGKTERLPSDWCSVRLNRCFGINACLKYECCGGFAVALVAGMPARCRPSR